MLQMVNARSISSCRLMRLTESSASDMIPPSLRRTNYFWTSKIRKNFAFHDSVLRLRLENTGVEGLRLLQAEPPRCIISAWSAGTHQVERILRAWMSAIHAA